MNTNELMAQLKKLSKIPTEEWMNNLEDRKRKESEFFDWSSEKQAAIWGEKGKFYETINKSTEYMEDWIAEHSKDKVFLDYACGEGGNAIRAAQAGARIAIGIDISRNTIQRAQEKAKKLGLTNLVFLQGDAEDTNLPDDCIDTVICSGMLHHLDLSYALSELRRILAPGGRILAIEALNYNFILKLYRILTPSARTEWEKDHILSLKDVHFAKHFFDLGEIRYWHITSIAGAFIPGMLPFLNILDSILTKVPLIRLMAWMFTFELLSKKDKANLLSKKDKTNLLQKAS
ncbi:MAG: class I SAM-dependent methyltransferase [bacterium]